MKCRLGIGSACRGDGWKIEEVGQTVAIVFRGREALELLDVERKAEVAVHERITCERSRTTRATA